MNIQSIFSKNQRQYLNEIISRNPLVDLFLNKHIPVVIYPGARLGRTAAQKLRGRGVNVVAFADTKEHKWGEIIDGLQVIAPQAINKSHPGCVVLVASAMYDSSIRENLVVNGVNRIYSMPFLSQVLPDVFGTREYRGLIDSIFAPGAKDEILKLDGFLSDNVSRVTFQAKLLYYLTLDKSLLELAQTSNPIYFDPDIFAASMGRIIADCGAFIGDTLAQFLEQAGGTFDRYYAFDPDPLIQERLHEVASTDPIRIQCIQSGLYKKTGVLHFKATGSADTVVVQDSDSSTISVPVVDLDSFFSNREAPTFIKMDIEGSEADALEGARNLIVRHRPAVAVSIYHKPSDLWKIPLMLTELLPASSIYIRHYTREIDDTVCYAVPVAG